MIISDYPLNLEISIVGIKIVVSFSSINFICETQYIYRLLVMVVLKDWIDLFWAKSSSEDHFDKEGFLFVCFKGWCYCCRLNISFAEIDYLDFKFNLDDLPLKSLF